MGVADGVIVDVGMVLGVMLVLEEALFIAIAGARTRPFEGDGFFSLIDGT